MGQCRPHRIMLAAAVARPQQHHRHVGLTRADLAREVETRIEPDFAIARELDVGDHTEDLLLVPLEVVPGLFIGMAQQDLGPRADAQQPFMVLQTTHSGGIVRTAHLPVYQRLAFPVAGLYDVNPDASRATAQRFGVQVRQAIRRIRLRKRRGGAK